MAAVGTSKSFGGALMHFGRRNVIPADRATGVQIKDQSWERVRIRHVHGMQPMVYLKQTLHGGGLTIAEW
jgi:hypothetical protein